MAEESESQQNRTEQASPRRLQNAREEGDVPIARDVVGVAALGMALTAIASIAPQLRDSLNNTVTHVLGTADNPSWTDLPGYAWPSVRLVLMACGGTAVGAITLSVAQTRGGFWPDRMSPDLTRLFRTDRLLRIFKLEGLADLGMSALKIVVVAVSVWFSVRNELPKLVALFDVPIEEILTRALAPLRHAMNGALAALLVLSAADFLLQRYRFMKRMRMTREELKRENKDEDGDPLLRSRRRRRHRQLSRQRVTSAIPKADAIVVNPTHIAVAIRYRRSEGSAPRVIAKGKGQLAEIIRDLARSHGIPIIEDVPLARLLYKRVKVGGRIPAETYKAVATVLAFVYRVTGIRPDASRR